MLHWPGVPAMTWRAASLPTPVRRSARTTKKSQIDVPPRGLGPGEEKVEAAVVEGAVGIGQVP